MRLTLALYKDFKAEKMNEEEVTSSKGRELIKSSEMVLQMGRLKIF